MPFGLSNALASLQSYINEILAKKLDIFIIVYLDNIFIYTKDAGQGHVAAVWWVLDLLRKNGLFANLKKCRFYKDEVRFLGYVVSAQGIEIEGKKIKAVQNWPKPKSVRDIQVFLGFTNFYCRFIQGFSKIVVPLTSMLKTTELPDVDGVVSGDLEPIWSKFKKTNLTKSKTLVKVKNYTNVGVTRFLIPKARVAFTWLRQTFTKAPILQHFDSECDIRIKTDASGYAIGGVLSQLTTDQVTLDLKLPPVAYFLRKMIPAKTRYETHDGELLAIIEAFKT